MKITRTGSLNTTSKSRRSGAAKSTGGSSFAKHMSTPASGADAQNVAGVGSVGGVDALLSLQEVGDALDSNGKARQRADDILDQLDELRHGLLMGTLNRRQLESLARMVRARRDTVTDPQLAEILDQIELRAEVELAKYATLD